MALRSRLVLTTAISLYPNPATSQIKVTSIQALADANIQIMDGQGKTVMVINGVSGTSINVNIYRLASGMYTMRVQISRNVSSVNFLKTN